MLQTLGVRENAVALALLRDMSVRDMSRVRPSWLVFLASEYHARARTRPVPTLFVVTLVSQTIGFSVSGTPPRWGFGLLRRDPCMWIVSPPTTVCEGSLYPQASDFSSLSNSDTISVAIPISSPHFLRYSYNEQRSHRRTNRLDCAFLTVFQHNSKWCALNSEDFCYDVLKFQMTS